MTTKISKRITDKLQEIITANKKTSANFVFSEDTKNLFLYVVNTAVSDAVNSLITNNDDEELKAHFGELKTEVLDDINHVKIHIRVYREDHTLSETISIQFVKNTPRPLEIKHSGTETNRLSRIDGFINLMQQIAERIVSNQKSDIYRALADEAKRERDRARLAQRGNFIVIGNSTGTEIVTLAIPEQLNKFQNETQIFELSEILVNTTDEIFEQAKKFGTVFQTGNTNEMVLGKAEQGQSFKTAVKNGGESLCMGLKDGKIPSAFDTND